LLQTDNHASTSPLSFYRLDALPAGKPTASKHWSKILLLLLLLPVLLQFYSHYIGQPECLQCFDTVGSVSERAFGLQKMRDEVLPWLSVWSEVQMICIWSSWCHCHHIISCFIKIRTGLTFLVLAYPGFHRKEAVKRVSCRITCVRRHSKLRTREFSWSRFTGRMPLLKATSALATPTWG